MIERAIRASIIELQDASEGADNGDAIQKAIQASVAETARERPGERANPTKSSDMAGVPDEQLEAALLLSLEETSVSDHHRGLADVDFDDSGIDTEDDANIKHAMQRSKRCLVPDPPVDGPKDKDFPKATETSEQRNGQNLNRSRTEEEIVLDYVKRQSLEEEQHRKAVAARKG